MIPPPVAPPGPNAPPPGQPVDPNAPKPIAPGFKGVAQQLTNKGKLGDARLYLYAAALMDQQDADVWKDVRWCQGLERPVLGLRFAFGYTLTGVKENLPGQGQPAQNLSPDQIEQQIQQERQRAFDQTTGMVGQKTLEAMLIRHSAGMFGAALAKPNNPNQPAPQPGQGNHSYATFIGAGEKKALLEAARRADADVLLWFEVQVGMNKKTNQSVATITARLMDPITGRQLAATKPLSSAQISTNPQNPNLAAGGVANDPVGLFVESLTGYLDKQLALTDTPELEAEKLHKRLAGQLLKAPENPLSLLLELAVYEQKKALPAAEVADYRKKLIGERETQVLQGKDEAEQRQILQRWLPRLPADVVMNTGAPGGIPAIGGRPQPVGDPAQAGTKTEPTGPKLDGGNLLNESLSNMRFVDSAGKALDIDQYKGKVVLLDFWAADNQLTAKNAVARKDLFAAHQARGFEIVGVCMHADRAAGDALAKDKGWTWLQFFDGQGANNAVSRALGVRMAGVSLLLDKTGKVRYVNLGAEDMNKAVALLLDEK